MVPSSRKQRKLAIRSQTRAATESSSKRWPLVGAGRSSAHRAERIHVFSRSPDTCCVSRTGFPPPGCPRTGGRARCTRVPAGVLPTCVGRATPCREAGSEQAAERRQDKTKRALLLRIPGNTFSGSTMPWLERWRANGEGLFQHRETFATGSQKEFPKTFTLAARGGGLLCLPSSRLSSAGLQNQSVFFLSDQREHKAPRKIGGLPAASAASPGEQAGQCSEPPPGATKLQGDPQRCWTKISTTKADHAGFFFAPA